jgi:hypothetical protein
MNWELKTPGSHNSLQTAESSEQCVWLASDHYSLHLDSLSLKQWECFLIAKGFKMKLRKHFPLLKPDAYGIRTPQGEMFCG